jgi:hypothetical protein
MLPPIPEDALASVRDTILCPIPCFRCGEHLEEVDEEGINQPHGAQVFISNGHYGATLFDPIDGSWLELNICDNCLKQYQSRGRILVGKQYAPRPRPQPKPTYQIWNPDE